MDVREIRRRNARYLAGKHGRTELSTALGYHDNNYLNQMTAGHSNIGNRTARRFEAALGLPSGWMDVQHPSQWGEEEDPVDLDGVLESMSTSDLSAVIDKALSILRGRNE